MLGTDPSVGYTKCKGSGITVEKEVGEKPGEGENSGVKVKPMVGVAGLDPVAESCGLMVSVGKIGWGVRVIFEG